MDYIPDKIEHDNEYNDNEEGIRELRAALLDQKADHYIPIFEKLDKGNASTWNWCAFFFGPCWFAYRKLYLWAVIAIAAPTAVGLLTVIMLNSQLPQLYQTAEGLSRILSLLFAVWFATTGNKSLKKRIDTLIASMPAEPNAREQYIAGKGGVSMFAVVVTIIIYMASFIAPFFLT